jgi:hypothetical protein
MDFALFERNDIAIDVQDFHHPRYPQRWGDFEAGLSSIDMLANVGFDKTRAWLES